MCGFQGTQKPYTISGDNGERDPPVPIPNTEVKPFSADGTWLETTWESRTLPDSTKKSLRRCLGLFLCASRQILLPGCFQANVQHCTWLGSPMCAACGGSSTWGNTWESRTLPDSMKKGLTPYGVGSFFSFHLQHSYSLVVSDEVRECTWLGSPMCAAGGGSSTWGNGTVKYYAQIHLQFWQNSVCTGQGNLPLIT